MKEEKLLSLVIPAYNSEIYLEQCILSILESIDPNSCEIVIVDDGSTDKTKTICDNYAQKYDFIKCYHTQNQGILKARLFGFKQATGKYIWSIDSDDFIERDSINKLLDIIINKNVDIILFDIFYYYNDQNKTYRRNLFNKNLFISLNEYTNLALSFKINSMYQKCIKKSLINIEALEKADRINMGDDFLLTVFSIENAKTIYYYYEPLYYYRREFIKKDTYLFPNIQKNIEYLSYAANHSSLINNILNNKKLFIKGSILELYIAIFPTLNNKAYFKSSISDIKKTYIYSYINKNIKNNYGLKYLILFFILKNNLFLPFKIIKTIYSNSK